VYKNYKTVLRLDRVTLFCVPPCSVRTGLLCVEIVYHRGETVRLPCNTTHRNFVQWNYGSHSGDRGVGVYENGLLDETYPRFSVEYPLVIRNAVADDQGYYWCLEDAGSGAERVRYHLVYEGIVLCHSQ